MLEAHCFEKLVGESRVGCQFNVLDSVKEIRGLPAVGCNPPSGAPFDRVWLRALLEGLVQLWGADVLSATLEEVEWWERKTWSTPLRDAAAELLGESQPSESNVQVLLDVLANGSQFDREAAAAVLGELGPVEGVVPALIHALEDDERGVRRATALALCTIGAEAGIVPALTKALGDEDHWARLAVMDPWRLSVRVRQKQSPN